MRAGASDKRYEDWRRQIYICYRSGRRNKRPGKAPEGDLCLCFLLRYQWLGQWFQMERALWEKSLRVTVKPWRVTTERCCLLMQKAAPIIEGRDSAASCSGNTAFCYVSRGTELSSTRLGSWRSKRNECWIVIGFLATVLQVQNHFFCQCCRSVDEGNFLRGSDYFVVVQAYKSWAGGENCWGYFRDTYSYVESVGVASNPPQNSPFLISYYSVTLSPVNRSCLLTTYIDHWFRFLVPAAMRHHLTLTSCWKKHK